MWKQRKLERNFKRKSDSEDEYGCSRKIKLNPWVEDSTKLAEYNRDIIEKKTEAGKWSHDGFCRLYPDDVANKAQSTLDSESIISLSSTDSESIKRKKKRKEKKERKSKKDKKAKRKKKDKKKGKKHKKRKKT